MNEPVKLAVVQTAAADNATNAEERMYREIYDAIMEHRLPARTKLAEQSLGEIYKLARHGVRKVLNQLAADGLVDLEPNRGAFIASPSAKEAQDMFDLRQALEQMVIEKAMDGANAVDTKVLREMVERERAAYMQGDRSLWIRLSANFHIELAKLSGNDLLVEMLRRLVSRTTLLISTNDTPGNQPCSFDEHLKVIEAIEQNDKPAALQEMADHLQQCSCRTPQKSDKGFDLRAALGKSRPAK
ncbi:GntR family transcriptional regulator [Undibacterium sp.]|jgi:DNA-binding GntR family transcriptional regulator|uniref:GntR family transcriptional regulator n=1 Tax=Undibacterium sp. TaxID=1914977 RepID=UPI002BE574C8|nr:GntR family transcriptional regulator [Undibacterium sp.]HTD03783.1 GntR family transcriptional regulator [Undibacterium sp.]